MQFLFTIATISLQACFLLPTSVGGKRYGSGGSSWGGGSSSSSWGGGSSSSSKWGGGGSSWRIGGGKSSTSVNSYGNGYVNPDKFSSTSQSYGGRYGRYPFGGYRRHFFYRPRRYGNRTSDSDDDDDYHEYFDRVVNGCQLTSVHSYRTVDIAQENATTRDDNWIGCTEEWEYEITYVDSENNTTTTFVSSPIQLYACEKNNACAECEDLRGEQFDALTLEAFPTTNSTLKNTNVLVDCFVPKDLNLVQNEFDCLNDACIFLSEKYETTQTSSISVTALIVYIAIGLFVVYLVTRLWIWKKRKSDSSSSSSSSSGISSSSSNQKDKQQAEQARDNNNTSTMYTSSNYEPNSTNYNAYDASAVSNSYVTTTATNHNAYAATTVPNSYVTATTATATAQSSYVSGVP